jgi:hypothetical protein
MSSYSKNQRQGHIRLKKKIHKDDEVKKLSRLG